MNKNRRRFVQAGLLGGAGLAAGSLPRAGFAQHTGDQGSGKLDILVLGGTGYIGPHMVSEALRRGHTVSLFNRGRTNDDIFPDLKHYQGDRDGGLDSLRGHTWDAVIDNSGYVPRHVADSARMLGKASSHYLFISTVAVYADLTKPNDEDSALAAIEDESVEEVTGDTYGPLKVLCEKRAATEIAGDDLTILRPTYICGPGDRTDRFTYWPVRTSKGGNMLWPGTPADNIQIIDVRDLANFTIDCVEKKTAGIYNTVTPAGQYAMGDLHEDCLAVSAADMTATWVDATYLEEQDLGERGSIPIWANPLGEYARVAMTSGERAIVNGLRNRPMRETTRDTLRWWETLPDERTASPRAGLSAELENELLEGWKKKNA